MPHKPRSLSKRRSETRSQSHPKTDRAAARSARRKRAEGKRPTTQAGSFVHEEMHHLESGRHGRRGPKSRKQAIAIGLSKARRRGIALPARPRARKKAG